MFYEFLSSACSHGFYDRSLHDNVHNNTLKNMHTLDLSLQLARHPLFHASLLTKYQVDCSMRKICFDRFLMWKNWNLNMTPKYPSMGSYTEYFVKWGVIIRRNLCRIWRCPRCVARILEAYIFVYSIHTSLLIIRVLCCKLAVFRLQRRFLSFKYV